MIPYLFSFLIRTYTCQQLMSLIILLYISIIVTFTMAIIMGLTWITLSWL